MAHRHSFVRRAPQLCPQCSNSIGTLNFSVGNSIRGHHQPSTNVITAQQPGTTVITATIAQSASSAGYFSTCPPAFDQSRSCEWNHQGCRHPGVQQNLTTTVTDTLGNPISGPFAWLTSPPTRLTSPPAVPAPSPPPFRVSRAWTRSASRPLATLLQSTSSDLTVRDCRSPPIPSYHCPRHHQRLCLVRRPRSVTLLFVD